MSSYKARKPGRRKPHKYQTEHQVKNGWSRWIRPIKRGYGLACCDCGLVHVLNFRIVPYGNGKKVEFQARRDNRKTAALRREDRKRNGQNK